MQIEHADSWAQFGLGGLVIAALFMLVYFLVREHRAERQEWIQAYKDQTTLSDSRQSETNDVIRELTKAINSR